MKERIFLAFSLMALVALGFAQTEIIQIDGFESPPAAVPQTGMAVCLSNDNLNTPQIISCTGTGQDGETRAGVPWPDPRFLDHGDGTVTDRLTHLVWLKNANCFGQESWDDAVQSVAGMGAGSCGLSDGSSSGDWRVPNIRELHSLIAFGVFDGILANPALPIGHPFQNVAANGEYWSSTPFASDTSWQRNATVTMRTGAISGIERFQAVTRYFWPVKN